MSKVRLIPSTVWEVISAEQNGDYFLSKSGIELNLVSLVGIIKSISQTSTFIDYEFNDRSGPSIIIKQFIYQEV